MKRLLVFVPVFVAIGSMPAMATIINVPDDYPTIQHGINASSPGDTVLVHPGTYVENINFNGHNIVLGSMFLTTGDTSYISATIIDGNSSGSVVTFDNGEDSTAIITGLTIQNGSDPISCGIYCLDSSPVICNNIISDNDGYGIRCRDCSPEIHNNTVTRNTYYGILCWNSSPLINMNTISQNRGGIRADNSSSLISNNTINENTSHGISIQYCNITIKNNTICLNTYEGEGGGIFSSVSTSVITNNAIYGNSARNGGGIYFQSSTDATITNTILWANNATYEGNEIYIESEAPIITYCNIQDTLWPGEGNISIDPLFHDFANGDYHLMSIACGDPSDSPCIDAGAPNILDSLLDCSWGLGAIPSDMGAFSGGDTVIVNTNVIINVPADYPTIQLAIDASNNGDTVLVQPDTYYENINFNGHNIVVGSMFMMTGDNSFISSTIIDGSGSGSVVTFNSGEDGTALISGFTVQNGWANHGGGIYCQNSDPVISNNIITRNSVNSFGGGILCLESSCIIINNLINGNSGNQGGGICCMEADPTIINNTISGNTADVSGGGIYCSLVSNPIIINTILWGDNAAYDPEIDYDDSSSPMFRFCDVQGGWAGEGNIDCDPMFCDPESGDFYLDAASCCVGAGEGGVDIGAFGVGCGPPIILSVVPSQNELNVFPNSDISVTFNIDMDESTINSSTFVVSGRSTGLLEGTITYDGPTVTATFDPLVDFEEGEVVTVVLTTGIQSSVGAPLESSYAWSFTIAVDGGTATFADYVDYDAGEGTWSIFAADLDGDGHLDLATANAYSNNSSVLLNNGDGTFAAHTDYPVGEEPWFVTAADLDGDGHMDLATANMYSEDVSVLLNNGDGTFATQSIYLVGEGPVSVIAADVDGDGDMDLAAANLISGTVSVLLNYGNGTFAPHSQYPAGDTPVEVHSADLDGDGDLDLATANYNFNNITVLLNNGDGTFASYTAYEVGDLPLSVFAADIDADGDLDLAASNCYSQDVSILLNDGDGNFAPQATYSTGDCPWSVKASDLDGDGDLDLVTSNEFSSDVSVLLNNGDGTFATHSDIAVGEEPYSVFAADLDGDGDMDLATGNHGSDNVSVLLNEAACEYLAGDCNHNGVPLELGDVITMIGMYRGAIEPEYTCDCPPHGDSFAPEADPNGNCIAFELGDVVTEIGAYRGTTEASSCEDCPGSRRIGRGDGNQPIVSPTLKFKVKSSAGDR